MVWEWLSMHPITECSINGKNLETLKIGQRKDTAVISDAIEAFKWMKFYALYGMNLFSETACFKRLMHSFFRVIGLHSVTVYPVDPYVDFNYTAHVIFQVSMHRGRKPGNLSLTGGVGPILVWLFLCFLYRKEGFLKYKRKETRICYEFSGMNYSLVGNIWAV